MPRPDQSPQSVAASRFPPADEGELNLYYLHSFFLDLKRELMMVQDVEATQIVDTFRYLRAKDPERYAIVKQRISMATMLLNDAAHLVSECMHWANVEAQFCPIEETEEFHDTPQSWLNVGKQQAQEQIQQQTPEQRNGHHAPAVTPQPAAVPEPNVAPEATSETTATEFPAPPKPSALRRHARTLRNDRDREMRRFYAIAGNCGLPTGPEAGPAIRAAFSQLLEKPIASRKDITAMEWSKGASALDTGDMVWHLDEAAPVPAKRPAPAQAASNGHSNGYVNGQGSLKAAHRQP